MRTIALLVAAVEATKLRSKAKSAATYHNYGWDDYTNGSGYSYGSTTDYMNTPYYNDYMNAGDSGSFSFTDGTGLMGGLMESSNTDYMNTPYYNDYMNAGETQMYDYT